MKVQSVAKRGLCGLDRRLFFRIPSRACYPRRCSPVQAAHDPPRVQAKLEVLEAELAAIAARPPQDDCAPDRKPNS